ncbi:RidA family protein [Rathayibacter sp. VKM Ac-2804]|uniref:RidA family protein n=1 Tax=Rathayibacter sp. VKM Ac-2804 TaxID=2609257 RepID=UPI00132F0772|nr:RidA family protein [Rathayibacter sp. VKM Ac-2804]QHF24555.1 RidA family protein [Rathayibacter sp. VKM Ac-2804]
MTAILTSSPERIAPPIGKYSHLVRVPSDRDLIFISGQVGVDRNGVLADGIEAQTHAVFDNIAELLLELDATPADIVRLLTFVTGDDAMAGFARARDEVYSLWYPNGTYPGHSLAIVAALAAPTLRIEMEGWVAVPRAQ